MIKNLYPTKEKNKLVNAITSLFLGYTLTFIVIIVYSLLLTYTSMTDKYIMFVVLTTTILSTALVGYQFARDAESRGIIWGILGGLLYGVVFIILGFFTAETYKFDSRTIFVLLFSIIAGGMGGIIGINNKK